MGVALSIAGPIVKDMIRRAIRSDPAKFREKGVD